MEEQEIAEPEEGPGPDYYYRERESVISKDEEDIGYNDGAPSQYSEEEDEEQPLDEDNLEPEYEPVVEELKEDQHETLLPQETQSERFETESVEGENFAGESVLSHGNQIEGYSQEDLVALERLLPKGFVPSALGELVRKGSNRLVDFLEPCLNQSGLIYEDLQLDGSFKNIRKNMLIPKCFKVTIISAKNILVPEGAQVLSRRLRVCLYDSTTTSVYLSNVHIMTSQWFSNDPKTWKFPSERGVIITRKDENSFMVRTTVTSPNLQLLFELCIYIKHQDKYFEYSCGWAKLPLWKNPKQKVIEFVQTELRLNGGHPSQNNIELQHQPIKPTLFNRNKEAFSTLTVKLSKLSREEVEAQSVLPNNIIVSLSTMYLASFYREILAETLLTPIERSYKVSRPLSEPVLAGFLEIVNSADALEIFKGIWILKLKVLKRNQREDHELLKRIFSKTVLETYPIVHLKNLPPEKGMSMERLNILREYSNTVKWEEKLMSTKFSYVPFTIEETMFDPPSYVQ